jgi:uncharacterized protein YdhG (YjbR/CyaY superfamily)
MASESRTTSTVFSEEERAAMKERAKEVRGKGSKGTGEADLLAKIAEMTGTDRSIAERVHAIVTEVAPELAPKTWYGQPAYAKDGKVVVFFQASAKFSTRYCTLGFNDVAALDDGSMGPTSYALTSLTEADERKIAALVKKAVS